MDAVDEAYFQHKEKICNWLIINDKAQKKSARKRGSLSTVSSSSAPSSKRSKMSKTTSRKSGVSVGSSQASRHTQQLAKIASLEAEAGLLQQTKEAELRAEMLAIQKKIAKAQAKVHVYAEEEKRFASLTEAVQDNPTTALKRTVPESKKPLCEPSDSLGRSGLQDTMTKMLKLQSAPTVVLDIFSGDPLEYEYFKATFREVVENTIDDQKGKLTRLIQYTSGEAKNLIKHLIHASGNGYDQAIKILDDEYGDVHTVTNSYLKELRLWPAIRSNDTVAFKNFHQFLVKCQTYKEGIRLMELDSADVIRTLVLKLHASYHEKWNRCADKSG